LAKIFGNLKLAQTMMKVLENNELYKALFDPKFPKDLENASPDLFGHIGRIRAKKFASAAAQFSIYCVITVYGISKIRTFNYN
jgi:hypothetical protein